MRDFFYPADKQDFLINYAKDNKYSFQNCSNAMEFYSKGIYLPVYEQLNEFDIDDIVSKLDNIFN